MIHYITTYGVGDAWVGNELRVMRKVGIPFRLHSLRKASSTYFMSPEIAELARETNYIYPLSIFSFIASLLLAPFVFRGQFVNALLNALTGPRESFSLRLKVLMHLGVACYWARQLRKENVSHIHSQWIHSGGTVGMYAAWLLNVSFSFTGHAADLFRERVALKDKIKRASFIICISEFHRDFYIENGANPKQLIIAYCGIDVSYFKPEENKNQSINLKIVASGRLVEKKGFTFLIDACKILHDEGFNFECIIGGSGPLEHALKQKIDLYGLSGKISVTGKAILQEEIPEFMHKGDVYCLPCVWASDKDVDGLPQMLMEAMACGLPVISTRLVGIPDLVVDGITGLLVAPNNAVKLAGAIKTLASDKKLARQLAKQGREAVQAKFNLENCLEPIIAEFRRRIKA